MIMSERSLKRCAPRATSRPRSAGCSKGSRARRAASAAGGGGRPRPVTADCSASVDAAPYGSSQGGGSTRPGAPHARAMREMGSDQLAPLPLPCPWGGGGTRPECVASGSRRAWLAAQRHA